MKDCFHQGKSRLASYCFAAASAAALFCLPASAYIIDNFDSNVKTGWADSLNGGTVTDASGQFTVTTTGTSGAVTYSVKTGGTYTNTLSASHTLEYRVDIKGGLTPAAPDANALAILGWVPSGGALLANGYSVAIGRHTFELRKNGTILNPVETRDPSLVVAGSVNNWTNSLANITMVLRITDAGGGQVNVTARIIKTTPDGIGQQLFQELYAYNVVNDTPGFALTGNVAVGVKNLAAATACSASYDNLQFFDMQNILVDDFNANNNTTLANNWFLLSAYNNFSIDTVTETSTPGQVFFQAQPHTGGGYAGCFYQARSFTIDTNGGRLEFSVELKGDDGSGNTYPVLGYIPGGRAGAASIKEYFVAPNPGAVYTGKQAGQYSGVGAPTPVYGNGPATPFPAGRLTVLMTGEGLNCRVETRLEDLTQDINSSNRVMWCQVWVDTPAQDPIVTSESSANKLPYLNVNGNLAITVFNAGSGVVNASFDNATAAFTVQPPQPPRLSNISPSGGVTGDPNYLSTNTVISFDATDPADLLKTDVSLTLNGVTYTSGSPGVTVTPPDTHSLTRHFSATGILAPNQNYVGTVQVKNASLLTDVAPMTFDTFLTNVLTVEMEEYNYTTNYDGSFNPIAPAGSFVDNYINCSPGGMCYSDYANGALYPRPETLAEGSTDNYAYNGKQGVAEIDFHSNHGPHAGQDGTHSFRTDDAVRTIRSSEVRRGYLASAGAPGDGGFNEEDLAGLHDGDWQNYTKTFTAGYYQVYMRQSIFNLPVAQVTLDKVTSDASVMGQSTSVQGSFLGADPGSAIHKNIPLSDGVGNPIILHIASGSNTFRVTERVTGNDSANTGITLQNYMVFAPVPAPVGSLRAMVSYASPPPNYVVANYTLPTEAKILNRDTSVDTSSVVLKINGNTVTATVTPTATGADVSWSLSVLPAARTLTNQLSFSDGSGVQTYTWLNSYLFLAASNSLPIGALTNRGFDVRMVQMDTPSAHDNTVLVGELDLNGQILPQDGTEPERKWQTNVMTIDWNDNTGSPNKVPGLDGGISGYPWPSPNGNYDNIATEVLGYLQLKAGAHRFNIASDDSMQLRSGSSLEDPNATQIATHDGTYYVPVDFMVEADGLYPIRGLWQEEGGYAEFHISSVNPDTSAARVVNDPAGDQSDPFLVKAYYPSLVLLYSSSTPNGIYTLDPTGVCDGNAQTMTVPQSGSAKFYKINGVGATKITKVSRSGSNIVLTYKLYNQPGF